MAKKKKTASPQRSLQEDKSPTLKDLLSSEVVDRLKAQANDIKKDEERRKEEVRKQAEEQRRAEQKKLESNFEYLLENSNQDWRKFK